MSSHQLPVTSHLVRGQFLNEVMDGRDLIDAIGVRTAEDEAVVYITVDGADEGHGNAVGGGRRVAGLEAVEAALRRDAVLGEGFDERVQERAAWHVDRALYDGDVALFGIHIHLFEFVSGVAFFGSDEAGRHLYAGEAEGEVVLDVFLIEDATAEDDGDLLFEFFFKFFDNGKDFFDFLLIAVAFVFFHLFSGVAEMSAGFRAFDNDHVGGAVVVAFPQFQDDAGGFRGADDRGDLGVGAFYAGGKVGGESGTGEDDVCAVFGSAAGIVFIVMAFGHDVHADDALLCFFSGFLQFGFQCAKVGIDGIGFEVWFIEAYIGSRDDTHAAFIGYGTGET